MNVIIVRVEDIVLNAHMVRLLLRIIPGWELAGNALHAPMMSANLQVNINVSHATALGMMIQKNVKNKKRQLNNRPPLLNNGWDTRTRTWIDGVRIRCPTIRRYPNFVCYYKLFYANYNWNFKKSVYFK